MLRLALRGAKQASPSTFPRRLLHSTPALYKDKPNVSSKGSAARSSKFDAPVAKVKSDDQKKKLDSERVDREKKKSDIRDKQKETQKKRTDAAAAKAKPGGGGVVTLRKKKKGGGKDDDDDDD
ncbi:hypothetical protein M885DRAFT_611778 [Pelagophyceae sp. CCMP2097]|nr:hypothetical protein M885DRAFT_611778 [Pelagophyceae sp. CCMP2097]